MDTLTGRTALFVWGTEKPHIIGEHICDSSKVNVWCAVTTTSIIGAYFHEANRVNGNSDLHMLETFVIENLSFSLRKNELSARCCAM